MGWQVGGRFKKERIYVYRWLIHVAVWQKPELPGGSVVKNLPANEGDLGSISGSRRSSIPGKSYGQRGSGGGVARVRHDLVTEQQQ